MCEADLDFEILMAQKRLDELKLKKLDFANRIVRKTQFDNLPESIENIAAHIAIREGASIYIIDAHDSYELFTVHQLASTNISFNDEGNVYIDDSWESIGFSKYIEERTVPYFGCVIIPDGDEYTIEPLNINSSGEILNWQD